MRYPIVIEPGTETTAFGVVIPDLPGCFSAGDSLDEAMTAAEEAAAAWIDAALDADQTIPPPSDLSAIRELPEYEGWTFGLITLDPGLLDDTIERVNITLPRRVLRRLDARARAANESRSGFIAHLTLEESRLSVCQPTDNSNDRQWPDFAARLIRAGYAVHQSCEIPMSESGAADVKVIALTLLCRTMSNLKGTLQLVQTKRVVEARILVRCCFENLFFVSALREKGERFLKDIFHDDMATRQLRGEFLLQIKRRDVDATWESHLRAFLKKMNQEHGRQSKTITPKGLAHIGPVKAAYVYYTQLSADAAHPTTDSLSRYLTRTQEGDTSVREIDIEPIVKASELSDTLNWACEASLGVIVRVNEILGGTEVNSEINSAADQYIAMNSNRS
jgi:predicted RNase H-like HicB family nuclease